MDIPLSRSQSKLIRKLKRRKRREESDAFLVEGVRLTEELLASGLRIDLIVTAPGLAETERGRRLLERIERGEWPHAHASDPDLSELADTETPQGVLAVAHRPEHRLTDHRPSGDPRVLVLDGVSDPGNLGTLVRLADALGVDWVVTLPGTVDAWNPKAVRASAGSLFRVPVSAEPWGRVTDWLRERGLPILVADARGEPVRRTRRPAGTGSATRGFALVLGSEASGPSEEILRTADRRVAIPLREGVESLNVAIAGALLLDRLIWCGGDGDG